MTRYCSHGRHDDCAGKIGLSGREDRPNCMCPCHCVSTAKYLDGHCVNTDCGNYYNACFMHCTSGNASEKCSREGIS